MRGERGMAVKKRKKKEIAQKVTLTFFWECSLRHWVKSRRKKKRNP